MQEEGRDTATMKTLNKHQGVLIKRAAESRGKTEIGWLHSRHTFSFGEYFDPDHMGFRSLRVINDDVVEPGRGFGTHSHRDAEIFSYVIEGELEHKDSMGNGSIIKAGDLQYMSAGSGVRHSEFNPSPKNPVHFLQIWLTPNVNGGAPRYAEKSLGDRAEKNALTLLFSGGQKRGAIELRQDAEIFFGRVDGGQSLRAAPGDGRHCWVHVIKGEIEIMDEALTAGDGAAILEAPVFEIRGRQDSEFLLFDLA